MKSVVVSPVEERSGVRSARDQEVAIRRNATEVRALERQREAPCGLAPCRRVGDHLGEHRVEVGPDDGPAFHARIPADLGVGRGLEGDEGADRGQKSFSLGPPRKAALRSPMSDAAGYRVAMSLCS